MEEQLSKLLYVLGAVKNTFEDIILWMSHDKVLIIRETSGTMAYYKVQKDSLQCQNSWVITYNNLLEAVDYATNR